MTEDQANLTRCCGPEGCGGNSSGGAERFCIASHCMGWRWSEAKRSLAFLEAVQAHMKASAKPNFNKSVSEVWTESGGQFERVEGACGLAGTPQ